MDEHRPKNSWTGAYIACKSASLTEGERSSLDRDGRILSFFLQRQDLSTKYPRYKTKVPASAIITYIPVFNRDEGFSERDCSDRIPRLGPSRSLILQNLLREWEYMPSMWGTHQVAVSVDKKVVKHHNS